MKNRLSFGIIGVLAGCATFAWIAPRAAAWVRPQDESGQLRPNQRIEAQIGGFQQHRYLVDLAAGDYFHAVVQQNGIDIIVELLGPDGSKLTYSDRDTGASGPEPIYWVAEHTGTHVLKITPFDSHAAPGRYVLEVREWRR